MHDPASCRELFDLLSAYLDGDLDAERCCALRDHVKDCAPCVAYLESLRATRDSLRAMGSGSALGEEETMRLLQECREAMIRRQGAGGKGIAS